MYKKRICWTIPGKHVCCAVDNKQINPDCDNRDRPGTLQKMGGERMNVWDLVQGGHLPAEITDKTWFYDKEIADCMHLHRKL